MNPNIRFRILDNTNYFSFIGTINADTKTNYIYEKAKPGTHDEKYRFGQYLTDTLNITIITTPKQYADLFYAVMCTNDALDDPAVCDFYEVYWDTPQGVMVRQVKGKLPYPSAMRFFSDKATFTLTTLPYLYYEALDPDRIWLNRLWNEATIGATYWVGIFNPARSMNATTI